MIFSKREHYKVNLEKFCDQQSSKRPTPNHLIFDVGYFKAINLFGYLPLIRMSFLTETTPGIALAIATAFSA